MEDLINQVFIDSENARTQIRDNQLCEPRLTSEEKHDGADNPLASGSLEDVYGNGNSAVHCNAHQKSHFAAGSRGPLFYRAGM
jgi:hypothetical protein